MGLIKEPKGVDFIIESRPLTPEEAEGLSQFIRQRKEEMKKKKPVGKASAAKKTKKLPA
ncbi:MAG: hypothetical protein KA165_02210 [Saprospiraceae bacterium]|nr:hypothetical protein [Saprospiraceae bacterium]